MHSGQTLKLIASDTRGTGNATAEELRLKQQESELSDTYCYELVSRAHGSMRLTNN